MTFDEYVRDCQTALLRYAMVLTGDAGLAEDVVQEVLVRLNGRWAGTGNQPTTTAYVKRMIVNEYLTWRRKWGRQVPFADVRPTQTTADHADQITQRHALVDELARLAPRQRAAIVLRYYEHRSDAQIAAAMGCSAAAVRGYVSKGLLRMRVQAVTDRVADDADIQTIEGVS